jgi:3-isopropylmalate dehydrogenase
MGAVGGPKWANVERAKRPEMGLLRLRKEMEVFANLRPALCFEALAEASPLKKEIVAGLDIMIVRELTGGVYFRDAAERRAARLRHAGLHIERDPSRGARRVRAGARAARPGAFGGEVERHGWREEVTALHKGEYSDVKLEHILADNCAMQLLKAPKQFDVIVTDNLFGDILSDEAAMLTGSIGLLPSAALGAPGKPGLYEPVHGSAPDIAGRGLANPLAALLSLAMALRLSLGMPEAADRLAHAVARALEGGARTADLGGTLSTAQMGDAVIAALRAS